MNDRPNSDLALAAWLRDEAQEGAPARLLAATRDRIETTRQRRPWWPVRRFTQMNTPARLIVAAAAIVLVVAVGFTLVATFKSNTGEIGGPTVTASPSPGPSASPTSLPTGLRDGPLSAGRYLAAPFAPVRFTFDVPDGWNGFGNSGVLPSDPGITSPNGMGLSFVQAGGLYSDPCHGTAADIAVGPSVDDLVNALAAQPSYGSSTPVAVTKSGYSGKRIDLQLPSDIDFATCTNGGGDPAAVAAGVGGYFVWESAQAGGANIYAQGPGDRFHLWIFDVDGVRAIILTQDFAGTSAQDKAAMQSIVDSIEITNTVPGAQSSPSPSP